MLIESTEQDISTIKRWAELDIDPAHRSIDPIWWLTGSPGSLLCFRFQDDFGVVCYVRIDEKDKDNLVKLHTQFAPREDVSRERLVQAMSEGIPMIMEFCKQKNAAGIFFESISPTLIYFMKKNFRFTDLSQDNFVLYLGQAGI